MFMKQWNRTVFILNYHFNTLETDTCLLYKLEKLPCIVSIVDISTWLDFDNQDLEQTAF